MSQAKRCQAKDPSKCRYHGKTTSSLLSTGEQFFREKEIVEHPENVNNTSPSLQYKRREGIDYNPDVEVSSNIGYYCDCDYIHRCNVITDTKVTPESISTIAKRTFVDWDDLPQRQQVEIKNIFAKHKIEDPDNYEVETIGGYYGEELEGIYFVNNKALKAELDAYMLSQPNHNDYDTILAYVRNRNVDTVGLTPLQAIKKQLQVENNLTLKYIEEARSIEVATIKLDNIVIPNLTHYNAVEPTITDLGDFNGVVYKRNGSYRLLDGYHRTKHLNTQTKKTTGKYIVLSK